MKKPEPIDKWLTYEKANWLNRHYRPRGWRPQGKTMDQLREELRVFEQRYGQEHIRRMKAAWRVYRNRNRDEKVTRSFRLSLHAVEDLEHLVTTNYPRSQKSEVVEWLIRNAHSLADEIREDVRRDFEARVAALEMKLKQAQAQLSKRRLDSSLGGLKRLGEPKDIQDIRLRLDQLAGSMDTLLLENCRQQVRLAHQKDDELTEAQTKEADELFLQRRALRTQGKSD